MSLPTFAQDGITQRIHESEIPAWEALRAEHLIKMEKQRLRRAEAARIAALRRDAANWRPKGAK